MESPTSQYRQQAQNPSFLYSFQGGSNDIAAHPRITTGSNNTASTENGKLSMELFLPSTFIILQGLEGDGMQNTMDILPRLPDPSTEQINNPVTPEVRSNPRPNSRLPSFVLNGIQEQRSSDEEEEVAGGFQNIYNASSAVESLSHSNASSSNSAMLSSLGSTEEDEHSTYQLQRPQQESQGSLPVNEVSQTSFEEEKLATSNETEIRVISSSTDDSFIVIQSDSTSRTVHDNNITNDTNTPTNPSIQQDANEVERQTEQAALKVIESWGKTCRAKELSQLEEFRSAKRNAYLHQTFSKAYAESFHMESGGRKRRRNWKKFKPRRWWQNNGKLVVLEHIPVILISGEGPDNTSHFKSSLSVVGELSPGTTVVGIELVTVEGKDLPPEEPLNAMNPAHVVMDANSCKIKFEFLRIESPIRGYILYRREGYNYLGHGLPANYCNPIEWFWRVTCLDGAFVREGLDLDTRHLSTLTYGSLVPVKARSVNEMGLCRLKVDLPQIPEGGWVSEYLNPLSGQRGPILQQLPYPVPVLYRVILDEGAVIRKDKELSSLEVRKAAAGSVLKVVGRAFSNYPEAQCVERLRLAGDEGWISLRLNIRPPGNHMVVEMVGIDGSFDPDNPGLYHLKALAEVEERNAAMEAANSARIRRISVDIASSSSSSNGSVSDDDSKSLQKKNPVKRRTTSGSIIKDGEVEENCLICLTEERNATIIHGGTGHIACCLDCSRILKGRGDNCPVCRLPIDAVIQQFWA